MLFQSAKQNNDMSLNDKCKWSFQQQEITANLFDNKTQSSKHANESLQHFQLICESVEREISADERKIQLYLILYLFRNAIDMQLKNNRSNLFDMYGLFTSIENGQMRLPNRKEPRE